MPRQSYIDDDGNVKYIDEEALMYMRDATTGDLVVVESTGGAMPTISSYGARENALSIADENTTTADAEVLAALTNCQTHNMLTITVSAFTATTLDITVSENSGTTFVAALPSKDSLSVAPAAIAAVGVYHLEGCFSDIKATQAGAGGVTAQYRRWVK